MSTDGHAAHASTHDQGHDSHNAGPSHGTLRSYLIGFALSVVLTAVPFWLVIRYGVVAREEAYLERRFGDVYRGYRARVRRWL